MIAIADTLIAFLWQGALIALGYLGLRQLTDSPQLRYLGGTVAMGACLLWPLVGLVPATPAVPTIAVDGGIAGAITFCWSVGASLCGLRTLAGLGYLRWWILRDRRAPGRELRDRTRALAARLGLRDVRLWLSGRIDVPQVVGLWRPIVLLPEGLERALTRAQLEAVLLHELIHLRRRDPWVQALQHVVETLFFYHPAVWWLSSELRAEREFCCDADVVACTGRRLAYAQALVAVEAQRRGSLPAIGLTGGSLMQRIRRIVEPGHRRPGSAVRSTLAALLLTALAATSWIAAESPREDSGPIAWMPGEVVQWEGLLTEVGARHRVDPALLSILALVESGGDPDAVSRLGARGLLQIMPGTGIKIAEARGIEGFEVEQLMNPELNADFGAWLLARHLENFAVEGDPAATVERAAAAYNGGVGAVRRGELSAETERYKRIVREMWLHRDATRAPTNPGTAR